MHSEASRSTAPTFLTTSEKVRQPVIFEKLVVANLPCGNGRKWVQTKKHKGLSAALTEEINSLKKVIKDNIPDGPNITWNGARQFKNKRVNLTLICM